MANKIFQDPTSQIPRNDPQFVRVPFEGSDIAGRQDHIPKTPKADQMNVQHVATKGTK